MGGKIYKMMGRVEETEPTTDSTELASEATETEVVEP